MRAITMTYSLAMAAAHDAASRQMRKQGRKEWNQEDWNLMVDEFERFYPLARECRERVEANR